jgi:hypothetical protein
MTALDYFVTLNFAFIFATIVQFAIVHYFTKIGSGEYYIPPPEILKRLELSRKETADKNKESQQSECNEENEGEHEEQDENEEGHTSVRHEPNDDQRRSENDHRKVTNVTQEETEDEEIVTERDHQFNNKSQPLMGNHVGLQTPTSSHRLTVNVSEGMMSEVRLNGGNQSTQNQSKQQVSLYPTSGMGSSQKTHSLSHLMKALDDDTRKEMTFQGTYSQQTPGYLSDRFSATLSPTEKVEGSSSSRSRKHLRDSYRKDSEATKAGPMSQHLSSNAASKSPSSSSRTIPQQSLSSSIMDPKKMLVGQIPQTSSSMEDETFRDFCPIHVSIFTFISNSSHHF